MDPKQAGPKPIRDFVPDEAACILCWLELFGFQDTKGGQTASKHFEQCKQCQDSIVQAERWLKIDGRKPVAWFARVRLSINRMKPLKSAEKTAILKVLAYRLALAAHNSASTGRRA